MAVGWPVAPRYTPAVAVVGAAVRPPDSGSGVGSAIGGGGGGGGGGGTASGSGSGVGSGSSSFACSMTFSARSRPRRSLSKVACEMRIACRRRRGWSDSGRSDECGMRVSSKSTGMTALSALSAASISSRTRSSSFSRRRLPSSSRASLQSGPISASRTSHLLTASSTASTQSSPGRMLSTSMNRFSRPISPERVVQATGIGAGVRAAIAYEDDHVGHVCNASHCRAARQQAHVSDRGASLDSAGRWPASRTIGRRSRSWIASSRLPPG